ncbi:hypothetical protein [Sphingorhabdus sp. Alg239-R122]|uniref:hypothetical protein n=1 Tax=Sphingorhabdus sp. Alg239-R122 TaxID=2305989 RepID=UPI0013D9932A|nr:hypothetical protein [Sphingorhabdus sp. Alg239-R122]
MRRDITGKSVTELPGPSHGRQGYPCHRPGHATRPRENIRIGGGIIYTTTSNDREWGGGLNIEAGF